MFMKNKNKTVLKRIWHFIWEDNSMASWLVNILLAFVLVKFIIYPGLGLLFGTSYPVVAVVSGSMTHDNLHFDTWWDANKEWYSGSGLTKEQFEEFPFYNGFNEGDIMVLFGTELPNVKTGEVIVYASHPDYPPIIHRVVNKQGVEYLETKGDHNVVPDKEKVNEEKLIGKAVLRIPYLGWVKIWFTELIKMIIGGW